MDNIVHKPTDEQQAAIDFIKHESGNLDLEAYAGAAKSTTLKMAAPEVDAKGVMLAFNFAIKEEIKAWAPPNFEALTLNGLGHRAWQSVLGRGKKLNVKDYKVSGLLRKRQMEDKLRDLVRQTVMACKAHGLVPSNIKSPGFIKTFIPDTAEGWEHLSTVAELDLTPDAISIAREVLAESVALAFNGEIDFADQIYMSCCFGGSFPSFEVGFVDEAQDLSPLNHFMVQKTLGRGRFIGVGDERQSIYAFRGADSDSIGKLRGAFKTKTLGLTTTFRCAKNLVSNVHWRAPAMRAAPWAPDGQVLRLKEWEISQIEADSAVICRNNAPLFAVGFALLQASIPIKFLGKGLEQGLVATLRLVGKNDPNMKADLVHGGIEDWRESELAKARAVGNDTKADRINDKADALLCIPGRNLAEIITNLGFLLNAEQGSITLCTGHKSKGLEFDSVYHLDSELIGKMAKTETQDIQERNLKYVIDTRAKTKLTYINRKGWTR